MRRERLAAQLLVVERFVQMGVGFVVGALVARHLGVADFGVLAFALACSMLVVPFATSAHSLLVRDAAAQPDRMPEVVASGIALHLVVNAAVVALAVGGLLLAGSAAPQGSVLPVLVVLIGALARPVVLLDTAFVAGLDVGPAVRARLAVTALMAVARVTAIAAGGDVVAFAAIVAAEPVLQGALLMRAYRVGVGDLRRLRPSRQYVRRIGREVLPVLGTSLSVVVYMRVDQAMLGVLATAVDSGMYAVAVTVSEVLFLFPVIGQTVLMPRLARLAAQDEAAFLRAVQALFTASLVLSAAAAAVVAALSTVLVPAVYGDAFEAAVPVVWVLVAALPAVALGVVQSTWFTIRRRQVLSLVCTATGALVNVALNAVLIPRHGAAGAAIATVVSYTVAGVVMNAAFRESRPLLRMQLRALRLAGVRAVGRNVRAAFTA